MSINQERAAELISKYVNGELTGEEHSELDDWVDELPVTRKLLLHNLTDKKWVASQLSTFERTDEEAGWQTLTKKYPLHPKVVPLRNNAWKYIAAAAVVFAVVITGAYFWYAKKGEPVLVQTEKLPVGFKNDIMPASDNKVTITRSDGTVVAVDDAQNGIVSQQAGSIINKKADQLIYDNSNATAGSSPLSYTIISIPRGKKTAIKLPDGSEVWLNAESSIKFSNTFNVKERNLELTGEGYFEVAKNKTKPFKVTVNGTVVEVLGTHFNIHAYTNESGIKTTLLEGSVKVESKEGSQEPVMIKPGQQAQTDKDGIIKVVEHEDLEQVMAWKNGQFSFKDADIETIMRDVERWYDAEIVYEGKVADHFVANIPKNVPASKLLELLELTNRVHFKVEGKKITVMP